MSSRKVREILRRRRLEFDAAVEESRKAAAKPKEEPAEEKPKKRGRTKKKVE